MNLTITGIHMDTGATLQQNAEARVTERLTRHFGHINAVHVSFEKDGHHTHLHRAKIRALVNEGEVEATDSARDPYVALDAALDKAIRQLEKHKGKLHKGRERARKSHLKERVADAVNAA